MKSNGRFGRVAGVFLLLATGRAVASNSTMNRSLFNEGYQMIFQMDAENRPNVDGAIAAFSRVIAEDSVPDDHALGQVFAWRGYAYVVKGVYAPALADFDKALSMKEDPKFRYKRGETLFWLGRYQEAMADFDKALPSLTGAELLGWFKPSDFALAMRARCLVHLGEYRKALEAFDRYDHAVSGGANFWLIERGTAYYHLGQLDEARAIADKALEQNPVLQDRFGGDNKLEMFELEKRGAAVKKAMEAAKKEEEAGQWASAFQNLEEAWSQVSMGDEPESVRQIREGLIRLYPKLKDKPALPGAARRYLVQAKMFLKGQGDPGPQGFDNQAVYRYNTVEGIAPWYPDAYYNWALIVAHDKQYRQAIGQMKVYLRLAPGALDAQAAQDKIYEWEASPAEPGPAIPPLPPIK